MRRSYRRPCWLALASGLAACQSDAPAEPRQPAALHDAPTPRAQSADQLRPLAAPAAGSPVTGQAEATGSTARATQPPDRIDVIFDLSMDPLSSPLEVGREGMSRLTLLLRAQGATVSTNVLPLEQVLPGWAERGRVLVLGLPFNRTYTPAALAAIDAFMRAGGGVLALTEHDNVYLHADAQNALTTRHGITTRHSFAEEKPRKGDPLVGSWPFVAVPAWSIERARLPLPATLAVTAPARALGQVKDPVHPEDAVVIADARVGAGRLVVVTDAEWVWNVTPEFGLRGDENARLALRVFGELAGLDGALAGVAPEPSVPSALRSGTRCVRFETAGSALVPEESPNGLMTLARSLRERGYAIELGPAREKRCEATLLVSPLRELGDSAIRRLARARLIVVADAVTDSFGYPGSPWAEAPIRFGKEPDERPLEPLLRALGLELARATLIDATDSTHVAATLEGREPLRLTRAASLSWQGDAYQGLIAAAPGTRRCHDLLPLTPRLPQRREDPVPRRPVLEGTPGPLWIAAKSARVFALADLELVSDQGLASAGGKALLAELLAWLEQEPTR